MYESTEAGPSSARDRDASIEVARLTNDASVTADAASGASDPKHRVDQDPARCRLVYGPAEQAFRGPASLLASPNELRLVTNEGGKPRVHTVPIGAPPPASARPIVPAKPTTFVGVRWPPCELAGPWAYCQAPGGVVNRTTLGKTDTKAVARGRPGTRIAAAQLGRDRAVVATLDLRRTTEGDTMQAFVTLDDRETVRLSDEGAGATAVRLVARGDHVLAVYLDARSSMVPVHARALVVRSSELALESDSVLFVGAPPERSIDFALAGTKASLFALLPIARETSEFGMAAIPIAEPLAMDVTPTWSLYPNGLDPAPIAGLIRAESGAERAARTTNPMSDIAAHEEGSATSTFAARVRPVDSSPSAPRILELGRVDASGAFTSLGAIGSGKPVTDIALATDSFGAVWILYGDTTSTWLERRVCPRE